jgi:hypothetical protein
LNKKPTPPSDNEDKKNKKTITSKNKVYEYNIIAQTRLDKNNYLKDTFQSTDNFLSFNRYKTPNNRSLKRDGSDMISVTKIKSKSITNDKKTTASNNSTSKNKNTFNTQKSKINFTTKKQTTMANDNQKSKEGSGAKSTLLSFINVKNINTTRKVELKTAAIKPDNRPKSMNVLRSTTSKNYLFS